LILAFPNFQDNLAAYISTGMVV